jgi:hypothetical protein
LSPAEIISLEHERRIRTALRWAQELLWEWQPEAGAAGDARTVAALLLIFRDPQLVAASDLSPHRLGATVRTIRAILARRERSAFLPARQTIIALREQSALEAPWLYRALGRRSAPPAPAALSRPLREA